VAELARQDGVTEFPLARNRSPAHRLPAKKLPRLWSFDTGGGCRPAYRAPYLTNVRVLTATRKTPNQEKRKTDGKKPGTLAARAAPTVTIKRP